MCVDSKTRDDVFGGSSANAAIGSAFSRQTPSAPSTQNLYAVPAPTPGTNSSQTPDCPSCRIGCSRPSQLLKSPLSRMPRADGAQTANDVPLTVPPRRVVVVHAGAQHGPELLVATLVEQVQVDLAERGQEAVGVVDLDGHVAVGDREPVVGDLGLVQAGGPHALVGVLHRALAARVAEHDRGGERLVDPHHDLAVDDMGSEHVVRMPVLAADDLVDLLAGDQPAHAAPPIWATAANGIDSQAGRLRVS